MPEYPTTRHVIESDCTRCRALVESRNRISWGTGDRDAAVLVVGEAPGYGNPEAERWRGGNWTGKAYTSRHSGRRIRELLEAVGFGEDAYYTNAVKCFPADEEQRPSETSDTAASGEQRSSDGERTEPATEDDRIANREPTPEERANCRTHLLAECELVDPSVVLATGKHATASVLAAEGRDLDGFLETVLEPVRCETLETWLLPVLHPSYQDVWIGRLGYEPDEYREAIREELEALTDRSNG